MMEGGQYNAKGTNNKGKGCKGVQIKWARRESVQRVQIKGPKEGKVCKRYKQWDKGAKHVKGANYIGKGVQIIQKLQTMGGKGCKGYK